MIDQDPSHIIDIKMEANNWLINHALPLWFDRGIDWQRGGFFESLEKDQLTCSADFKRLRVLTRQIYVFSAGCHMQQSYCKTAVIHGLDFLLTKARRADGGFSSLFNLNGHALEADLDLYDLAFCLFSLAHGYRLLSDARLKEEAVKLMLFVTDRLSHPAGGFQEGLKAGIPRRQNPHMHLLESVLEWRLMSDDIIFCDTSDHLIKLFFEKFYISESGALIEYFDNELKPLSGHKGEITEPGHHFEWVWLLNRYNKTSTSYMPEFDNLYDFAHTYGINYNDGMLWAQVSKYGEPLDHKVRLWPHAEWLKAELVATNNERGPHRISQSWNALSRFLDHPQPGLWHETYDHINKLFVPSASPASSLYHITLAIECLNNHINWHVDS